MQFDPRLTQYLDYLDAMQAQRYAKGGKVVDLLAEILKGSSKAKPKPTKDQPDPGRRAALGLPKDLTPKPGEVVVKEEVKKAPKKGETSVSLTEAMNVPMSRRDVLRAGAGQAISAMAPRGALGALAKAATSPVGVAEQVVKAAPVPFNPTTVAGIIAQGIAKGLPDEKIAKAVMKAKGYEDDYFDEILEITGNMRNPYDVWDTTDELYAPGPLQILRGFVDHPEDLRGTLREIQKTNPDLYKDLIDAARETDMSIAENAPAGTFRSRLDSAKRYAKEQGVPFDEAKFRRYYGYEDDYNPRTLFDDIEDRFGDTDNYDD